MQIQLEIVLKKQLQYTVQELHDGGGRVHPPEGGIGATSATPRRMILKVNFRIESGADRASGVSAPPAGGKLEPPS